MLYERWRTLALSRRSERALHDVGNGRAWTFGEVLDQADQQPAPTEKIVCPSGASAAFFFDVLRAWRWKIPLCPLEIGQPLPGTSTWPAGIAHLKSTSATTGAPRLIALTEAQLAADAENVVATMGLRPDWPNVGVISLAHSYGFSNLVTPLLLHGIPLILADSPLPEPLRRVAALASALTLPAVPALWSTWHDAAAIPPQVRLAISAGAPLPLPLEEEIYQVRGLKVHNFYGASECGGIAYDASTIPRTDAACVGSPLRGVQLRVGTDGCLEVRSAAVAETYWPQPEPELAAGCYRTRDLVDLRGEQVHLLGRATDQINVAGRKLHPAVVEESLRLCELVKDCMVFGMPSADPTRVEEVAAVVVLREAGSLEALREFLLARLPAWQVPKIWRQAPALEVNQRGKLSRAEWRRKLLAERG